MPMLPDGNIPVVIITQAPADRSRERRQEGLSKG